jgi:hypothetical protein
MNELIARFAVGVVNLATGSDVWTLGSRPSLLNALIESGYGNHLALVLIACAYMILAVYIIRRACPEFRIWP